jgi:hypothetical protein
MPEEVLKNVVSRPDPPTELGVRTSGLLPRIRQAPTATRWISTPAGVCSLLCGTLAADEEQLVNNP